MLANGFGAWQFDLKDVCDEVRVRGYVNLRTDASDAAIAELATLVGHATGARSFGMVTVRGNGAGSWLPMHTESISLGESDMNELFALGCLESAPVGGATCLYDGRRAAHALAASVPEVLGVQIRYRSHAYPGEEATHPLICDDPEYGLVLRYRSQLDTNTVVNVPSAMGEDELYRTVDEAVRNALTLTHRWREGDFLLVNNRTMIHAREPYDGSRALVRCRYDDPRHRTIEIGR
ncbi:TauD/TfdA family dioxygenase [Actinoplanes sp. CA-252034]|uniref:TauD/TfdA family dioxygenase n=1 Tax=Actinoplanes sp. CA-252034 TaxID=3239906 RepID=UPI003D966B1F